MIDSRYGFKTLLMIAAVVALAGCVKGSPSATVNEPTAVSTTAAVVGPAHPVIAFHGVIAFRDETRLSFKVGGLIRHISVDTGARVRAGERLADIEPTEIEAQVTQAQQLDEKAARDLERGERLRADEVITLEQLQNLRTQRELAAAQLRAVRFNRERSALIAQRDGTVLRRLAEENELVQPGQPVLVLGSPVRGQLVRAAVSDRVLVQLRRGDHVSVAVDALRGTEVSGTVSAIALAADQASGLFPVEVTLDATSLELASGMVATVRVSPAKARETPLVRVPASAIVAANGDRASVFVVTDGKAHRRAVSIAFLEDAQVALSDGLGAGEIVVSAGAPYLDDGEAVRVSAQPAPATTDRATATP